MSALAGMFAWDVRLQVRYGFYAVYAVLTAAYVLAFLAVPPGLAERLLPVLVLTDPAVLGFYFVAALVLIEKRQGVLDALVVSPLGLRGYLLSKAASLTLLAVAVSLALVAVVHPGGVDFALLAVGVGLTSAFFVLVGFVAVARFDAINDYFLSAVVYGAVLFAPLLATAGVFDTPLFYLLPARPALVLVDGAIGGRPAWALAYGVAYLALGSGLAFVAAERQFRRHVVEGRPARRDRASHRPGRRSAWVEARVGPVGGMVVADLRNWVRDPILSVAAVGPLALAVVLRLALPVVDGQYLPGISLRPYYPLALAFAAAFPPYIYGFVVGFLVLEDREQGVLDALRTTPLTTRGYLAYRGGTALVLAGLLVVPTVVLFGLVRVPPLVLVGTTLVLAALGPAVAFLFASLADDSIEGVAISKLLNLTLVVPVVGMLVLPEPWEYVVGVLPPYWPMKALVVGVGAGFGVEFLALLGIGLAVVWGSVWYLVRQFSRVVT